MFLVPGTSFLLDCLVLFSFRSVLVFSFFFFNLLAFVFVESISVSQGELGADSFTGRTALSYQDAFHLSLASDCTSSTSILILQSLGILHTYHTTPPVPAPQFACPTYGDGSIPTVGM